MKGDNWILKLNSNLKCNDIQSAFIFGILYPILGYISYVIFS